MTDAPVLCFWDGEALRPASRFWQSRADELWTVGHRYLVEAVEERSARSHRHYFAVIHDAWSNLPDELLEYYPTPEHLRKKALVFKGYRNERSFVCSSPLEARRMAAFIAPMDDFALVSVNDTAVVVLTAKSQSLRSMDRREFQASKQAVLDFIATLLGVRGIDGTVDAINDLDCE